MAASSFLFTKSYRHGITLFNFWPRIIGRSGSNHTFPPIFAKVELFNFGQITNHLSLPFPVFQPPFCPDNNAIWRSFQDLMYNCCICPVWKMLLLIFCPTQTKQPLDQWLPRQRRIQWILKRWPPRKNRCSETQRLLGGASLKLALCQTGAQHLAWDVSTGNFRPIVPLKFKTIFDHFHYVAHPGRLASHRIISSRLVWRGLSSNVTTWARGCLACQRSKIHRHVHGSITHPHPTTALFSPPCRFSRPFAVQK